MLFVIGNDPSSPTTPIPVSLRVRGTTSVRGSEAIPRAFALHQNYPNPFNPETNISFDLPVNAFVTLKVFNLIGQEVATIVSGELEAGKHSYTIGKEKLGMSSGVYFYRLQARGSEAQSFVATRKLILLK